MKFYIKNFFSKSDQIRRFLSVFPKFLKKIVLITFNFFKSFALQRNSRPEVFCEKGVLRNFARFTGKHLCQSLFFNKDEGSTCNLLKKEALTLVFFREFCKISKNTFSIEHLRWLLLFLHSCSTCTKCRK